GRPRALHVVGDLDRHAVRQGGPAQAARHRGGEARAGAARRADGGRAGPRRLRGERLVRARRAGEDAQEHRRSRQRRSGESAQERGSDPAARELGLDPDRRGPGVSREAHQERNRALEPRAHRRGRAADELTVTLQKARAIAWGVFVLTLAGAFLAPEPGGKLLAIAWLGSIVALLAIRSRSKVKSGVAQKPGTRLWIIAAIAVVLALADAFASQGLLALVLCAVG